MSDTKDTLHQISDELMEILKDECAAIPWKSTVMGPTYPKELTGFVCCDSVEYEPFSKADTKAVAVFTVEIICPNPKTAEVGDTRAIEQLAMNVKRVLRKNNTIDGWAQDSSVDKILFATPAGIANTGVAVLQFSIQFVDQN